MNKERLLQVADMIEKGHHKFNGINAAFNMEGWFYSVAGSTDEQELRYFQEDNIPKRSDLPKGNECNTTACIAGWACLMFDYENASKDGKDAVTYSFATKAAEFLSLTQNQANNLFCTYTNDDITGEMAAKVIRHFVETGEVAWFRLVMKDFYSDDELDDSDDDDEFDDG